MASRRRSQRLPERDCWKRSARTAFSASEAEPTVLARCINSFPVQTLSSHVFLLLLLLLVNGSSTAEIGATTDSPYHTSDQTSLSHPSIRVPLMPSGHPMVTFHRMTQPDRGTAPPLPQGVPADAAATAATEGLTGLRAKGEEANSQPFLGGVTSASDSSERVREVRVRAGASARMALSELTRRGVRRGSSRRVGPVSPAASTGSSSSSSRSTSSVSSLPAPRLGSDLVSPSYLSISYHDGPIMTGTVSVYLIYYGNWGAGSGQDIIENFIRSITNGSVDSKGMSVRKWFNMHSLFTNKAGETASTNITLAGTFYDTRTDDLVDMDSVANVIESLQASGSLPYDNNAVYAVLSSSGIQQYVGMDAFCTTFCGWHSYYVASNGANTFNIKYMFVGYSSDCNGCQNTYADVAPNGHPEMEGMVTSLAHQITETVTDPLFDGYWDGYYGENADPCSELFPGTGGSGSPPYYNVYGINGYKYLLQATVNPVNNTCQLGNTNVPSDGSSPPAPDPAPNVCSNATAGTKCSCASGKGTRDGCVCNKNGSCVSLCQAYSGRRCRTCSRFLCFCKQGTCKWWLAP